jgi:hypothetical protein
MRKIILFFIILILFTACDYKRYDKVHVEIYFKEKYIDPIKTDINWLLIYEDKIEMYKYVRSGKKGDIKLKCLVFKKSEYDSLYFKPIKNLNLK